MKHSFADAGLDPRRGSRPGLATLWVMIVMFVMATLIAAITWQFLTARRLLDHRQNQLQALWLARAGIEVAAARLLDEPTGYKGETLPIIPQSKVRIQVQQDKDAPNSFLITSEAHFPSEGTGKVMRSLARRFRRVSAKGHVHLEAVALSIATQKKP